ncbi:MAG: pseudoazurin [Pseudomonadota bacterium]
MTSRMTRRTFMASTAAAALATSASAQSESVVEMLNKSPDDPRLRMVFSPRIIVVKPGDTVKFAAVDRGHNSASVDGMLPDGAAEWNGKINEEVTVSFDAPGFYGYKCTPHAATGMVGLVIVEGEGMMANLEAAKGVKQRGRAAKVWDEIWAEVDAMEFATA